MTSTPITQSPIGEQIHERVKMSGSMGRMNAWYNVVYDPPNSWVSIANVFADWNCFVLKILNTCNLTDQFRASSH